MIDMEMESKLQFKLNAYEEKAQRITIKWNNFYSSRASGA